VSLGWGERERFFEGRPATLVAKRQAPEEKMDSSSVSEATARPSGAIVLHAAVAAVLALAVAGAVVAAGMLARGGDGHAASVGGPAQALTSFGAVAALHVERIGGLTSKDLAGMTHGVNYLVPAKSMQVQASLVLTNRLGRPVAYAPGQFRLRVGEGDKAIPAQSSTFPAGSLPAGASVEGRLGFVVPRTTGQLWLEFREAGGTDTVLVDLGRGAVASGTGRKTGDGGELNFNPLGSQGGDNHAPDHG
jgi:hypothetical protein